MVIVNLLGQVCTLGRAPRTKETLPDFHEWCRVTRHPRLFRGLKGCQRTPRVLGHHKFSLGPFYTFVALSLMVLYQLESLHLDDYNLIYSQNKNRVFYKILTAFPLKT